MTEHFEDWRWPDFSPNEMRCHCGCGQVRMNQHFMDLLQTVRRQYAAPMIITSGYRCPDHNEAVSSTGRDGPHTTGRAVDIAISGAEAHHLLSIVLSLRSRFTGIGLKQRGPHAKRFMHIDDLEGETRPWIWTYA